MSTKLVVFDWDGTLIDSQARIIDCMLAAARDLDCRRPTVWEVRDIIGLGLNEAIERLFPELDSLTRERIAMRYRQHFLVENITPTPLFTGARDVLQRLTEAGYLLGVATGKSRGGLNLSMDISGLRSFFHATRCADESFSKPHPDMLMQLMDELGTVPGETLMIGDTEYDMEMASNAGTFSLGVGYGVHPCSRLRKHLPTGCVESLKEIPNWLTTTIRTGVFHNPKSRERNA